MFAGRRGRPLLGGTTWSATEPSMGAEDFFMLQNIKLSGAYLRIGCGSASGSALHNSRYDFNDDILLLGRFASLIEQAMRCWQPDATLV